MKKPLCYVNLNTDIEINFDVILKPSDGKRTVYIDMDGVHKKFDFKYKKKTFGYLLGIYFGGNRKAPHSMKIKLKKDLIF